MVTPKPIERVKKAQVNQLWTDKYAPKASTDLVGNKAVIDNFKEWLADW